MPPGLVSISYDAGCFRYHDGGFADGYGDIDITVYGDGSIDIQADEKTGITIEALEWIVNHAKEKRKAAFNEDA